MNNDTVAKIHTCIAMVLILIIAVLMITNTISIIIGALLCIIVTILHAILLGVL